MSVESVVNRYEKIYEEMKKEFKWSFVNKKVLLHASMTYAVQPHIPFDSQQFKGLCNKISKDASMFSPLKQDKRLTVAAILETKFDDPQSEFQYMKRIYDLLVKKKFRRGAATYTTALVILSQADQIESLDEYVDRVMAIHKGMKKEHPFITSEYDYPLAALLAVDHQDTDHLMNRIEYYYEQLAKNGFRKGCDLQFLSHILSLDDEHNPEEVISRTLAARDAWKQSGMKHKGLHYPVTGLLALAGGDSLLFDTISETSEDLNRRKSFRWEKEWNSLVAANITMRTTLDPDESLSVSMYASLNTVLEAQNAAMVAAATAGAVAATSSSGN